MAEIDTISVTTPDSTHDNHPNDDTTAAEHEDSGLEPRGDLKLEELVPATDDSADAAVEPTPVQAVNSKEGARVNKKAMSVTPAKKLNGGPPTPTVKNIINSGTFGAGSVKAAGTKVSSSTAPSVSKPTAPTLRKATTTTTSATASKPAVAPSALNKPVATKATSNRRASVVPTRTTVPPPVRQSLSASVSWKASSESAAVRSGVVSPTGSVASASGKATSVVRPRASVSDAVKKAPVSTRPSVASSTRAPPPTKSSTVSRSSAAPPARSTKTTGSISSIKEVKEDNKVVEELHAQLSEARKTLESKGELVASLENQVEKLDQSLETKLAELGLSRTSETDSDNARKEAEAQLQHSQNALSSAQKDLQEITATLHSAQEELESVNSKATSQAALAEQLETRIQQLETDIALSEEKIQLLERDHAMSTTSASEAAANEHEALLAAQANFSSISNEVDALKLVHTKALQESESRIAELLEKVASTDALQAQVSSLKAEKEENANKLSELEVEILELKEAHDALEDARDTLQKQIANHEDELAKAAVAAAVAAEHASSKDTTHAQELVKLAEQYEQELEAGSTRYNEIVSSLEALKSDLLAAEAAKEKAEKALLGSEETSSSGMAELEQEHATRRASLEAKLESIAQELQSQESIYASKVDAVKAEHAQLVEEAFERAKNEAAQAHTEELAALRSNSNSMIQEVQTAHRDEVQALKLEHENILETEINDFKKQINTLNVELKATQDDLHKAKAAVEASHGEIESLTQQRDFARSQADAVPALSPEHADEIARLTKELSVTKDDLAAMTDMLDFTKSSMSGLSDKHSMELQEAAQARADEVSKLRDAHDIEVNTLAKQKSDLLVRLSDLEGELATAKASLEAQQTANPKNNGNGITHSPSRGITKEELTKMHEAHNLKVYDLEAGHDKAMKLMREEMEVALFKVGELQQDLARKAMEIQYLEQEQDESTEQITRLKEDLERLGHVESKS